MEIKIDTEFIKLDSLLKYANIVETGGIGKLLIQNGEVLLNGEIETRRGKKVYPGDTVDVRGEIIEVK